MEIGREEGKERGTLWVLEKEGEARKKGGADQGGQERKAGTARGERRLQRDPGGGMSGGGAQRRANGAECGARFRWEQFRQ